MGELYQNEKWLRQCKQANWTNVDMAREAGCAPGTIGTYLRRYGITKSTQKSGTPPTRDHRADTHDFLLPILPAVVIGGGGYVAWSLWCEEFTLKAGGIAVGVAVAIYTIVATLVGTKEYWLPLLEVAFQRDLDQDGTIGMKPSSVSKSRSDVQRIAMGIVSGQSLVWSTEEWDVSKAAFRKVTKALFEAGYLAYRKSGVRNSGLKVVDQEGLREVAMGEQPQGKAPRRVQVYANGSENGEVFLD